MSLENIVEVKRLFSEDEVNAHLKAGWILLIATSEASPNTAEFSAVTIYSVGLPREVSAS